MNDIDEKSKEFLKWCEDKFEDKEYIYELYHEILNQAIDFLNKSPYEALRAEVITKMIAGAKEHGEPSRSLTKINNEIRKEMLDFVGWSLMRKYREDMEE